MAVTMNWTYGSKDEELLDDSITQLNTMMQSIASALETTVSSLPSYSSPTEVQSSLMKEVRKRADTLDDQNYCRAQDSGQNYPVDAAELVGRLNSKNGTVCAGTHYYPDYTSNNSHDGHDPSDYNSNNSDNPVDESGSYMGWEGCGGCYYN